MTEAGTRYSIEIKDLNSLFGNRVSIYMVNEIDEYNVEKMYRFYDTLLDATITNYEEAARYIAAFFAVPYDDVKFEFIEPVVEVIVHKITGFPMYRFNTEGKKFIAMIEKNSGETRDYVIRIQMNNEIANMLTLDGVKTGRMFRTVLLKRLNDWFKETFNKRAQFKWGTNIEMK